MANQHFMSCSVDKHPAPLRIEPRRRVEEVVRDIDVRAVRLEELEVEAAQDRGEGQVYLCVCYARTEYVSGSTRPVQCRNR